MNFYNHRKLGFIYVGIDCHKATHTACIISPFNDILDKMTFKNNKKDFNIIITYAEKGRSFQEIAENIIIRKLKEM